MDQSWKLSGAKYGIVMDIMRYLYGQVKPIFFNFLMLPYLRSMGLVRIWTISRYLSYMEKIWKKTKLQSVLHDFRILPIYGENMEEN